MLPRSPCNSPRQFSVSRSFSSSRKLESLWAELVAVLTCPVQCSAVQQSKWLVTSFISQTASLRSRSLTVRAREALHTTQLPTAAHRLLASPLESVGIVLFPLGGGDPVFLGSDGPGPRGGRRGGPGPQPHPLPAPPAPSFVKIKK